GCKPALGGEAIEQSLLARERTGALWQLAEHGCRAAPALAPGQGQLAAEPLQERRLASAVAAEQREPVTVAQLQVDRPDAEAVALDDRLREPRDYVGAARGRREREPRRTRRPRLLAPCEPTELLGRSLLHVLRLLLLATLAVAALLPLPHPSGLL